MKKKQGWAWQAPDLKQTRSTKDLCTHRHEQLRLYPQQPYLPARTTSLPDSLCTNLLSHDWAALIQPAVFLFIATVTSSFHNPVSQLTLNLMLLHHFPKKAVLS